MSAHPYLDITIPTLSDPTLAPSNQHVVSIHAQFAPYKLKGGDWDTKREELGNTIIATLSEYAPDIRQLIKGQRVITPVDLETKYGFRGGHIHHGEMSLDQLFAFRPVIGCARYRTPIEGLYLCGAGTHPGGGLSGGSGLNASREILYRGKRFELVFFVEALRDRVEQPKPTARDFLGEQPIEISECKVSAFRGRQLLGRVDRR